MSPISRASARQRAGRAGRIRPGKCYRCKFSTCSLPFKVFGMRVIIKYRPYIDDNFGLFDSLEL